jgi:hypothetical protein
MKIKLTKTNREQIQDTFDALLICQTVLRNNLNLNARLTKSDMEDMEESINISCSKLACFMEKVNQKTKKVFKLPKI